MSVRGPLAVDRIQIIRNLVMDFSNKPLSPVEMVEKVDIITEHINQIDSAVREHDASMRTNYSNWNLEIS